MFGYEIYSVVALVVGVGLFVAALLGLRKLPLASRLAFACGAVGLEAALLTRMAEGYLVVAVLGFGLAGIAEAVAKRGKSRPFDSG